MFVICDAVLLGHLSVSMQPLFLVLTNRNIVVARALIHLIFDMFEEY